MLDHQIEFNVGVVVDDSFMIDEHNEVNCRQDMKFDLEFNSLG